MLEEARVCQIAMEDTTDDKGHTYPEPRPTSTVKTIFRRRVICSLHTSGIGIRIIAMSISVLITASARMVAGLEPQKPGRDRFQFLANGRHMRNSWRNTPIPKDTTTAATTYVV